MDAEAVTLFEVGQMVTWEQNSSSPVVSQNIEKRIEDYGPGPFRIVEVIDASKASGVGHPQWVVIAKEDATIDNWFMSPQHFSGAWFKLA